MLRLTPLWMCLCGVLASGIAVPNAQAQTAAQIQQASLSASNEGAAAHLVAALLDYVRWPPASNGASVNPLRLCLAGAVRHREPFEHLALPSGRAVRSRSIEASAHIGADSCDALYIGAMPLPQMRQITQRLHGTGVVSIAENDPDCRSEAMFCLFTTAQTLSFQINIDAVSRSGVMVDPRVLRLSHRARS